MVNARIRQKIDTTANWSLRTTFIPMDGEIIVYSDYATVNGVNVPNFKIGDGLAYVVDLPFVNDDIRETLTSHINNNTRHITAQERTFWNNKVTTDDVDIENERLILTRS